MWCECTPTARAVKDTHCDAVAKPTTSQKCEAIVLPDKLVWGPDPCECGTQQSAVQTCSSCDRPPGQADCRLVAGALPATLRACVAKSSATERASSVEYSSGGIVAPIDMATGRLRPAQDAHAKRQLYARHPYHAAAIEGVVKTVPGAGIAWK